MLALYGSPIQYLADTIKLRKTSCSPRYTTMGYLEELRSHVVTYGLRDRSFNVAGPKLWNNLPFQIRKSSSIQSFTKELESLVSFGFNIVKCHEFLIWLLYKFHYYYYNHNYIKILESDWSSTALISAVIEQLYASCLSNWTVRVIKVALVALEWLFFFGM